MSAGPVRDEGTTPAGPESWPPAVRWPPALHRAVHSLGSMTDAATAATPLVALSGGADSLALAVATAEAVRTRANPVLAAGAGAVVVDHGLQPGSAVVARRAAAVARQLGLEPVIVEQVTVASTGAGPEADARQARYAALESAARRVGSTAILTAHTRDDQAEQVLLGLARGSGTRSLAGIPRQRGLFLRPLLDLTRQDTESICRWAGLQWWEDPANADPAYLRSRVRTRILPRLEDPDDGLGPGVAAALARSADMAAEDADALELWAGREFGRLAEYGPGSAVSLTVEGLSALPDAVRYRVLAAAAVAASGQRPSRERVLAVDRLVSGRSVGGGSAGPVELAGGLVARRRRTDGYARLVFDVGWPRSSSRASPSTDTSTDPPPTPSR
ncbi:tRNA lysidine(34) synthetase TilS [Citricoccus sp. GCM10030269]|uniref:tRNA lysidine(34) synthetase TilS n=1 Tax=Citricoccus sp. GCM10030269 TaxID=3273388 RepID=UPI00361A1D53